MTFITWITDQHNLLIIATVLFALSEALALIPAVQSNSVFQMIFGIISKAKAALTPKV